MCYKFTSEMAWKVLSTWSPRETLEVSPQLTQISPCLPFFVIGEGIVVEVPSGMHVSAIDDIESLIGRRAEQNILHPLNGRF